MSAVLKIRPAKPEDKIAVAALMVLAMGELALKFVSSSNLSDAIPVFELFFQQKDNQYSYENAFVCEDADGIVGFITGYDGSKINILRQPFIEYLKMNYGFSRSIEEETSAGEFYLDTISISPDKQRLGIGTALVKVFMDHAKALGHAKVGLLVDKENPEARKLYERIGFELVKDKILLDREYFHLVYDIKRI